MSKIKQNLPLILTLLAEAGKYVKPIADAIVESGGLGFRKRMKTFVEETQEALSKKDEAIKQLAETQADDTEQLEKELAALREEIQLLKAKLPA
jgi:polyhydroxyalkanoate synthesis regulator phasin